MHVFSIQLNSILHITYTQPLTFIQISCFWYWEFVICWILPGASSKHPSSQLLCFPAEGRGQPGFRKASPLQAGMRRAGHKKGRGYGCTPPTNVSPGRGEGSVARERDWGMLSDQLCSLSFLYYHRNLPTSMILVSMLILGTVHWCEKRLLPCKKTHVKCLLDPSQWKRVWIWLLWFTTYCKMEAPPHLCGRDVRA